MEEKLEEKFEIIGKFFDENLLFKSNSFTEGRHLGFESQAERIKRKIAEFVSWKFPKVFFETDVSYAHD